MSAELIARIEHYLDAAPRLRAEAETVGPFTLFRSAHALPYFARPSLGWAVGYVMASDVEAVCARQRQLGISESLEWINETAPDLSTACLDAGLTIAEHPLLVHHESLAVPVPDGLRVRRVDRRDDPAIAASQVVATLAFASAGTAIADIGPEQRDALLGARPDAAADELRELIHDGRAVLVVAEDEHGVLATGRHHPAGQVTELVGVGTLPCVRRQGLGAAVTDTLVADAIRRGIDVIFLGADDPDVARVYERVGFRQVGTTCVARRVQ